MDDETLTLLAGQLIDSYTEAAAQKRSFFEEYQSPQTSMTTIHQMRSLVIANLSKLDAFELSQHYIEFGRVEFLDTRSGSQFLLRSKSACLFEQPLSDSAGLFPAHDLVELSETQLLVYSFTNTGLSLETQGCVRRSNGSRLHAFGESTHLGFWPFETDHVYNQSFSQDSADSFSEIGAIDFSQERVRR